MPLTYGLWLSCIKHIIYFSFKYHGNFKPWPKEFEDSICCQSLCSWFQRYIVKLIFYATGLQYTCTCKPVWRLAIHVLLFRERCVLLLHCKILKHPPPPPGGRGVSHTSVLPIHVHQPLKWTLNGVSRHVTFPP